MLNKTLLYLILIMTSALMPVLCFEHDNGKIEGRITDKKTGEALVGVNVILRGTVLGDATDTKGEFKIINISHGDYFLEASYIGYSTFKQHVHIDDDQKIVFDIKITQTVLSLSTVVVTATRTRKTIEDVPIRTEVIPEHVIESSQDKNVLELLHDSLELSFK